MRETMFRFWDSFNEHFTYSEGSSLSLFFERYEKTKEGSNNPVLMQYTGLKDAKGKKIYEGDVLRLSGDYDVFEEVRPIEIFECDAFKVYGYGFCSNHFSDSKEYNEPELRRFYSYNPVVVGNIHENPELLENILQDD